MSKFTNAQKANVARANAENTARQIAANAGVASAKAQKKQQKREAAKQILIAQQRAKDLEEEKQKEKEFFEKDKQRKRERDREFKVESIVNKFIVSIREAIWRRKVLKITKLAERSSKNNIICFRFNLFGYFRNSPYSSKTFYYVFEVEEDGFSLDFSVYRNYIIPKIISESKMFNPKDYRRIFETAICVLDNVDSFLDDDNYFGLFDDMKVIKCISFQNAKYRNLVEEFKSPFYEGVISILAECLIHAFEKWVISNNLNITKVSKSFCNQYDRMRFNTGILYSIGCKQCTTNSYEYQYFDIGFDPKSKMHSLLYKQEHYTIADFECLFRKLTSDGMINQKPICQECVEKNEIDQEMRYVALKLAGLVSIDETYKVKVPMGISPFSDESMKPCIVMTTIPELLGVEKYFQNIEIILNISFNRDQDYLFDDDDDERHYNTYDSLHYPLTKRVINKKTTKYMARVPTFDRLILWRPYADVTIAFQRMQIAFILCQSMTAYGLPDEIYRYIFSFLVIPDMDSRVICNRYFDLGKLDNPKLIKKFIDFVNFRVCA